MKELWKRIELAWRFMIAPAWLVDDMADSIKNKCDVWLFDSSEQYVVIHRQGEQFVAEPNNLTQDEFDNLLGYKADWQDCE